MPSQPGLQPDGRKIREIRVARGITVTDLARRIGRHRESLYWIERRPPGRPRPISDVLASQLARALSTPDEPVTVADILADGDGGDPDARSQQVA